MDFNLSNDTGDIDPAETLPSIPPSLQPAASVTTHLASRFYASSPATRISSHALAVLNPYQVAKNVNEEGTTVPELLDLAEGALARLSRLSENQTFLFLYAGLP